jgi:hypothetical protein
MEKSTGRPGSRQGDPSDVSVNGMPRASPYGLEERSRQTGSVAGAGRNAYSTINKAAYRISIPTRELTNNAEAKTDAPPLVYRLVMAKSVVVRATSTSMIAL